MNVKTAERTTPESKQSLQYMVIHELSNSDFALTTSYKK